MSNTIEHSPQPHNGLTVTEVEESRKKYGENRLTPPPRPSILSLYLDKYRDPIIRILLVAAAVSLIFSFIEGDFIETIGIFIAIIMATTIGFYFEYDAARKFNILNELGEEQAVKVKRDGVVYTVSRHELVVGDVILLEVGDEVPADAVLFESTDLQIDESSLTGEPIITKYADPNKGHQEATYAANVVLRSTMVMSGKGAAVVTAVGDRTEIGKVARSSGEMTHVKTPLNQQLEGLAKLINKVGFTVAITSFTIFLAHDMFTDAVWQSTNYLHMAEHVLTYFMMAVTLLVMAVPEGLPMAVTLSLALNMRRMLKNNNLVRKLHACETMGAVTVICTDKTGTLTQNKMQVSEIFTYSHSDILPNAIALNTTAHLNRNEQAKDNQEASDRGIGNPTEIALLLWLEKEGHNYETLRKAENVIDQQPFSTERKYMASLVRIQNDTWLVVKGAPEIVMQYCEMDPSLREKVQETLLRCQQRAMRTLAFACQKVTDHALTDTWKKSLPHHLTLQAITAIADPLRADVPEAVKQCISAGIDVKIVTGDTAATAKEIGRQIGIHDTPNHDNTHITGPEFEALSDVEAAERVKVLKVMSRARPSDKQRLVNLLQAQGQIVAVTGDGTNDAPALNHAHVGLSLGSGTNVAKEASDMTLLDDSFSSIVHAVMWGRSLYNNIRRFLFFQLVVNLTALVLVLIGSIIGTELPLTVTQILWVNLIMDTFAALALASLPPSKEVMQEKPRNPQTPILSSIMRNAILAWGLLFAITLSALLVYCEYGSAPGLQDYEMTLFFNIFVMLQVWNLFNAKALFSNYSAFHGLLKDKGLLLVLIMIVVGQWMIVTFGGKMFRTVPLSATEWLISIVATSPVLVLGELIRWWTRRKTIA